MTRKIFMSLATLGCIMSSVPAWATFHLMRIVEVFPGAETASTAQYVMLQMYFPGQNFVSTHSLQVFDAAGTNLGSFTFASDVANGADLATILIATADAQTLFGISADLTMTPVMPLSGGAVCWDVVDCVAWGSFSGASTLPTMLSAPVFNAGSGLVLGMAIHRDLSAGGAVSAFVPAPPAPRNNAGQSGTLPAQGPTPTATATATPGAGTCIGDCNGGRRVSIDDILLMVNIALGQADASACLAGDKNHDGKISVDELIAAVDNALNGCPS